MRVSAAVAALSRHEPWYASLACKHCNLSMGPFLDMMTQIGTPEAVQGPPENPQKLSTKMEHDSGGFLGVAWGFSGAPICLGGSLRSPYGRLFHFVRSSSSSLCPRGSD